MEQSAAGPEVRKLEVSFETLTNLVRSIRKDTNDYFVYEYSGNEADHLSATIKAAPIVEINENPENPKKTIEIVISKEWLLDNIKKYE